MKVTCLDTETTSLPNWRAPSDDPSQPYMVQIAAMFTEPAETPAGVRMIKRTLNTLIKPEGWTIDERLVDDYGKPTAFASHGITNARAQAEGRPLADVMDELDAEYMAQSDEVLAYGAGFDRRILRIAGLRRWGRDGHPRKGAAPSVWRCLLQTVTPMVGLAPTKKMLAAGFTKPKPPKLAEAHQWAFGEGFAHAHDALADLQATFRLWQHVVALHGPDIIVRLAEKD